jgi:sortase A
MTDRIGQKPGLAAWDRFERFALFSSVLIWAGAIVFGIGLVIALNNHRVEQVAYANAAADMAPETEADADAPAPTAQLYPAGWSTATPTPVQVPTGTPGPAPTRGVRANTRPSTRSSLPVTQKAPLQPTPTPLPTLYPPDRLVIPTIKLDSAVVPIGWTMVEQDGQTSRVWTVADDVVGWHKTSALPSSLGNVVLNGHHNIKGEVFRYLVDLEVGDRVIVYARERVFYYAVTEKHILKEKGEPIEVRQQNASWMGPTGDERVTMITCWPYTNNTHRLIVVAKPIASLALEELERLQEP